MIELPSCPPIKEAVPRYVSFAVDQDPILGGPQSKVLRMGDRWAIDVETYPAEYAEHGMKYLSRLVRGLKETVRLAFPEPGVKPRSYGTPVVASNGASGTSLPVSGLIPGDVIKEGKFFSMIIGGESYLYQVAVADVAVSAGGTATLQIEPVLRRQPPAGTALDFEPKIEGFVQGNEQAWNTSRSKYLPFRFTIKERA
ncbi:hypothetical protein [Brevundimonas diminuta]|uniref:Uncharacterized protein n=2 Tax=Brevundimonas diminuta TaxID=293 RepID=A0A410NVI4_BREDI|nr:hypothetical protein [Brevundimonas diminuta]QAT13890.1 hypothetical protein EQG53_05670 [Brevundimonas diminuta]QQB88744.1 hypothetical protein I6H83_16755 [Brevundimonas diminuta]